MTGRGLPMRPSEDFGQFSHTARAAMLFLGAGTDHPALHNPDYDFPDDLLPLGVRIFPPHRPRPAGLNALHPARAPSI